MPQDINLKPLEERTDKIWNRSIRRMVGYTAMASFAYSTVFYHHQNLNMTTILMMSGGFLLGTQLHKYNSLFDRVNIGGAAFTGSFVGETLHNMLKSYS